MSAKAPILPSKWRSQTGLSQAAVARLVNVSGKNPSRTWDRWEKGERQPPLEVIQEVRRLSRGKVDIESWIAAQQHFATRQVAA